MIWRLPEWLVNAVSGVLFLVGLVGIVALLHLLPDGTEAARQAQHLMSAAP